MLVQRVTTLLRKGGLSCMADAFEFIPRGWYALTKRSRGEEASEVFVFRHQMTCWKALIKDIQGLSLQQLSSRLANPDALHRDYFGDCDQPTPSVEEILRVLGYFIAHRAAPPLHVCEDREASDPYRIAHRIWSQNLSAHETHRLIERAYQSHLARAIYEDLRSFRAAIDDALYERQRPDESTAPIRGEVVFDEDFSSPLSPGSHDLEAALSVALQGAEVLLKKNLQDAITARWTDRPIKGWLANHNATSQNKTLRGQIRVNCLLNSDALSRDALAFLLWHITLHIHLRTDQHTEHLREAERRWPRWHEAELDLARVAKQLDDARW